MSDIARIFVLSGAVERFKAQAIEINHPFELYVDERCREQLLDLLQGEQWKGKFFRVIAQMMLDRFGNKRLYGKEPNGTTAMKIEAAGLNSRLICMELGNGKVVIMGYVEENKTRQKAQSRKTEGIYASLPKREYILKT